MKAPEHCKKSMKLITVTGDGIMTPQHLYLQCEKCGEIEKKSKEEGKTIF